MALADFLDTLTSPKGFKISYSLEEAVEIIQSESGKQFDPKIVPVMVSIISDGTVYKL